MRRDSHLHPTQISPSLTALLLVLLLQQKQQEQIDEEAAKVPCRVRTKGSVKPRLKQQDRVRQELHEQLLRIPPSVFEELIARLLSCLGYCEVEVLRAFNAERASHKGRTAHGGADLTARLHSDLSDSLTPVQAKQYRRPVSRRFVDELRGALVRIGASHGLLVTTSSFSSLAHVAAADPAFLPVRLVDGSDLLDLLFAHEVGVRHTPRGWKIDRTLLGRPSEPGGRRRKRKAPSGAAKPAKSRVPVYEQVTVHDSSASSCGCGTLHHTKEEVP